MYNFKSIHDFKLTLKTLNTNSLKKLWRRLKGMWLLSVKCGLNVRLKSPEKWGFMPEIQLFEVRLIVPRDLLAYESKWIENNSKVNLAKLTCSSNDVIRRHRTWWQQCSGTRCDQRDLKATLELELRLWLKDQSQRTV